MKKYSFIALLLLATLCTGCTNQYFTVDTDNESFHGAFISRDLSHGDVQMQNEKGDVQCAGVLFINEFDKTKDDNNKKYSEASVQLSCSDGRLLKGTLQGYTTTNWSGKIQDQFKKEYELTVISKKEYKNEFGNAKYTKQSYLGLIEKLVKY